MKRRRSAGTHSLVNPPRPSRSQPEKKNVDLIVAGPITFNQATANLTLLNGNTYGNTATTHVGRKIRMTSIQYRWRGGTSSANTATGSSALRMLVVYDKQANHAAPTALQVCTVDSIVSPMNLNFSQRFVVLFDEIIAPYTPQYGVDGTAAFYRKGYKATNLVTEFNTGSVGDITDIETGSIYALFWQDGNILVGTPSNAVYFRMKYEDV